MLMCLSGGVYIFASLTTGLQESLGVSAKVESRLVTALSSGTFFSCAPGAAVDRYGPKPTVVCGAVLLLVGFGSLALLTSGADGRGGATIAVCGGVAMTCVGLGSSCLLNATIVTNTNNYGAAERGSVLSVLVACFSLSSGLSSAWYYGVFDQDISAFLYFLACLGSLGALAASLAMTRLPEPIRAGHRGVANVNAARLGVVALAVLSLASAIGACADAARDAIVVLSGLACVCCLMYICRVYGAAPSIAFGVAPAPAPRTEDDEDAPLAGSRKRVDVEDESSLTLAQALVTREYWLMSFAFSVVVSVGLTCNDELSALADAVTSPGEGDAELVASAVAVFAGVNTLTKLGVGPLAGHLAGRRATSASGPSPKRSVPSVAALVVASASAVVVAVLLLLLATSMRSPALLLSGVAVLAVGFGASWVLLPLVVRDAFGPAHYGAIHGSVAVSYAISTFFVYSVLATDDLAAHENYDGACFDASDCMALTLDVALGLAAFAVLAAKALDSRLQARPKAAPIGR